MCLNLFNTNALSVMNFRGKSILSQEQGKLKRLGVLLFWTAALAWTGLGAQEGFKIHFLPESASPLFVSGQPLLPVYDDQSCLYRLGMLADAAGGYCLGLSRVFMPGAVQATETFFQVLEETRGYGGFVLQDLGEINGSRRFAAAGQNGQSLKLWLGNWDREGQKWNLDLLLEQIDPDPSVQTKTLGMACRSLDQVHILAGLAWGQRNTLYICSPGDARILDSRESPSPGLSTYRLLDAWGEASQPCMVSILGMAGTSLVQVWNLDSPESGGVACQSARELDSPFAGIVVERLEAKKGLLFASGTVLLGFDAQGDRTWTMKQAPDDLMEFLRSMSDGSPGYICAPEVMEKGCLIQSGRGTAWWHPGNREPTKNLVEHGQILCQDSTACLVFKPQDLGICHGSFSGLSEGEDFGILETPLSQGLELCTADEGCSPGQIMSAGQDGFSLLELMSQVPGAVLSCRVQGRLAWMQCGRFILEICHE